MLNPIVINKDSVIDFGRPAQPIATVELRYDGEPFWTNKDGLMEAENAD